MKSEPSDELTLKRDADESNDDNVPLDLSCTKPKRSCPDNHWSSPHAYAVHPLTTAGDQFQELNDLATAALLLNNIKQEQGHMHSSTNLLDFTHSNLHSLLSNSMMSPYNLASSLHQEASMANFKQIELTIREKFQYPQPMPIPDGRSCRRERAIDFITYACLDVQSGWWLIQTSDDLRVLIKALAKRGQRERSLCRMLQRYFDVLTNSMKSNVALVPSKLESASPSSMDNNNDNDHVPDEQQTSFNDGLDLDQQTFDDTHEMDVLNEIYNLCDRIVASSLQSRSYDGTSSRKRLTYADIQAKGSDIVDEAKQLLTDLERNIERRYLKHPFVRKYEINLSSLNRINQHSTYHHTDEQSTNEIVSSSKYDEVPQQLERWRRTVQESRTPAQLALCLTQLERCIAWERSIMRVYCEICNSDVDEEKLLLCDGCDHGTHTYCFMPPMSFIPPNDW